MVPIAAEVVSTRTSSASAETVSSCATPAGFSVMSRLAAWPTTSWIPVTCTFANPESIADTVDKELRSRLQSLRAFLAGKGAGDLSTLGEELAKNAAIMPAGTHLRIADGQGRWLYQSRGTSQWGAPPALAALPRRGRGATVYENGVPIRVLSAPTPHGLVQIGLPLDERRERLEALLDRRNRTVRLSEAFDDGEALLEAAKKQGLEGIVAKRADSRYTPGRRSKSCSWAPTSHCRAACSPRRRRRPVTNLHGRTARAGRPRAKAP